MTIGSLFSGIGALELGLERAGLGPTIWQVESDPFCRRVLARHWPNAQRFEDVRNVGSAELVRPEILCGGFPCQDVSVAGKGAGLAGRRSGLWAEFSRIVGELQPRWVVVENVANGAKRWVDDVCSELAKLGYGALPVPLSAEDVGAPHVRRSVFVIAHAIGEPVRVEQQRGPEGRARQVRDPGQSEPLDDGPAGRTPGPSGWAPVPEVHRVDDGPAARLDPEYRALGNAVVPQCAEVVGWMIRELAESGE